MITEQFINSCFHLILSKTPNDNLIQSDKKIFSDMLNTLKVYENKKQIEIPINIQNKYDCLKKICELKVNKGETTEYAVDNVFLSDKFLDLKDYIETTREEELDNEQIDDILKQIRVRVKISQLFYSNYDAMNDFFTNVKSGNFDSSDDLLKAYESFIKEQHMLIMEFDRNDNSKKSSNLSICEDVCDDITTSIKLKYDKKNKLPTGYSIFDDLIFYGGFDPGRLYMFAGGSGAGKSTLLLNLISNVADTYARKNLIEQKEEGIDNVVIYVTMENPIDESVFRLYMSIKNRNQDEALEDIDSGINVREEVSNYFKNGRTNVLLKFYPAYSIGCFELMSILDDAIAKYGKNKIKGLYLDYLDLLISHKQNELYRLELSYIAATLKIIANHYNIPIITATQLNRSIYTIISPDELNLSQMSEAIKKVEHADFVLLMGQDKFEPDLIHAKVGKNRCGKNGVPLGFKFDFERYKLLNCYKNNNTTKNDPNEAIKNFDESVCTFDLGTMNEKNPSLDIGEI
jgi:replicative DNA helicase